MARQKTQKITTPVSTDLSKAGVTVPEEPGTVAGTLEAFKTIMEKLPAQRGDIIQICPADKEVKHPLMANIMIVHEVRDNKLVCYQPGRGGRPTKCVVESIDAVVVGHARLKYQADKALPDGERPAYDNPLDKI